MRRGSVVGPLIVILIGVLFLVNNLRPDLSMMQVLVTGWPYLLILWGGLRLVEVLFWFLRRRPLPVSGVSGGEWTMILLISVVGSGVFFTVRHVGWPPVNMRLRGLEMLGEAFDYPIPEKTVAVGVRPSRLVIEHMRGNARVTAADIAEVRVGGRKTVRALSREDADQAADRLRFEVVHEGDTVFVRQTGQPGRPVDLLVSADLDITVPRNIRVEGRGRRGDFDITGVAGDIDIESDNAGIRLQDIGGSVRIELRNSDIVRAVNVRGGIDLKGSGRDVELQRVAGQVVVAGSWSGELQFRELSRPIRYEGGLNSRGVDWSVESCPGQIRMTRGSLTLDNVTGPVSVNAKSKDVEIADFTQGLDLHLERGDVDIRAGVNPVPRMNVSTNAGNVELTLPENARFALKATVDKGDLENDFGSMLQVHEEGRGGTISGMVAGGPDLTFYARRGSVRVRKGVVAGLKLPATPVKPIPPAAARSLVIERN